MKKIIIPIIITATLVLLNTVANAQTKTEDTTKVKFEKKEQVKLGKKAEAADTTKQTKITVNDDGVKGKKKVKKGAGAANGNTSNSTTKKDDSIFFKTKTDE